MSTTPPPLSEADYEAIESAVMETMRGRWFLAEYARRNRHADTKMLLVALDRIEASLRGEGSVETVDRIRFDIVEMAKAIARTKVEIAAIKPDAAHQGKFGEAEEELDSIVLAAEAATSDILAAAEQIQEVAWTLREQGMEAEVCDLLDSKATDVYTACSFQDLTGQRTEKVIKVLHHLESRINAMISIWGLEGAMAAEADEAARARAGEAALLNGPARPGHGLDQSDVDVVMRPAEHANVTPGAKAPVAKPPVRPAAPAKPARVEELAKAVPAAPVVPAAATPAAPPKPAPAARPAPAPPQPTPVAQPTTIAPPLAPAPETPAMAPAAPERAPEMSAARQSDPLAALNALSYEEKIALFT
jgi:chemotaxis regulatin CheY-phosphate phosphatase CheZ